MDTANEERPAAGQTIIIERRERVGLFRRLLGPALVLIALLALFAGVLSRESGFPTRLTERYVAGALTTAKVAVVAVDGFLDDRAAEHVLKQVRQARDDDDVRAVVLRVDSPGGSVAAADRIWREVALLKKPVVASMGAMAASGGYYVAAPARTILAEPTTVTGSIGVILELPQLGELLEKLGVRVATVATGEWKDAGSIFHKDLTEKERRRWQAMIDETHRRFVAVVAQGRKLPESQVRALADGRVFTAAEARDLKLVDRIGYLDDAIKEAWNLAKLETSRVIRYVQPVDLAEALLSLAAPKPDLRLEPATLLRSQPPRMLYIAR